MSTLSWFEITTFSFGNKLPKISYQAFGDSQEPLAKIEVTPRGIRIYIAISDKQGKVVGGAEYVVDDKGIVLVSIAIDLGKKDGLYRTLVCEDKRKVYYVELTTEEGFREKKQEVYYRGNIAEQLKNLLRDSENRDTVLDQIDRDLDKQTEERVVYGSFGKYPEALLKVLGISKESTTFIVRTGEVKSKSTLVSVQFTDQGIELTYRRDDFDKDRKGDYAFVKTTFETKLDGRLISVDY
ncbi:MAG: hypothetical protein WC315_06105, partial [Candidatus Omnitrophota bacterium]